MCHKLGQIQDLEEGGGGGVKPQTGDDEVQSSNEGSWGAFYWKNLKI